MSTHSGIQLILIGLFLLGGFAAVLTALLRRNRNPRAVPALVAVVAFLFLCLGSVVMVLVQTMQNSGMVLFALLILTAVVMLCGMVWFLLGHVREMNKTILALLMTYLLVVLFVTLLSRQGQHNTSVIMELELFRALKMQDTDVLRHLLQNAALFVPLGVLLPLLHRSLRSVWWALLGGAAVDFWYFTWSRNIRPPCARPCRSCFISRSALKTVARGSSTMRPRRSRHYESCYHGRRPRHPHRRAGRGSPQADAAH